MEVRPRREGKGLDQGRGELPGQNPCDPPEACGQCGQTQVSRQRQVSGTRLLPGQRDQGPDKSVGGAPWKKSCDQPRQHITLPTETLLCQQRSV